MSYKSRVHWAINSCIKFDCSNRDKLCNECVAYSKYPHQEVKDDKDIVHTSHKVLATRGDFQLCRECDKNHLDYNRFENPEDRKKITTEYFQKQQEARDKLRRKGGLGIWEKVEK